MSVLSHRVAREAWSKAVFVSALAVGCAEGAQDGKLDEGTLSGAGTAGMSASGTAGMTATSGSGGGGSPSTAGSSGSGAMTAGMGGGGAGSGGGGAGGAGGAGAGGGGAGGASGSGGSGGQPAGESFRYAKLVATSEQTGKVWSSCAELNLFTTGGEAVSRNSWKVTADSEEMDDESTPATAVFDNAPATFWHTEWEPGGVGDAALPHQLVIDMGVAQPVTGFSYLPRQEGTNGRIGGWEFYLSKDGTTWGTAVKTGTFPGGLDVQKISF